MQCFLFFKIRFKKYVKHTHKRRTAAQYIISYILRGNGFTRNIKLLTFFFDAELQTKQNKQKKNRGGKTLSQVPRHHPTVGKSAPGRQSGGVEKVENLTYEMCLP